MVTKSPFCYDFDRVPTNPGNPIHEIYQLDKSLDGTEKLVKIGEENTDDLIQSHRDSCDLKTLIKRHEMLGTIDQLADHGNGYLDLSQMPNNLHDIKKTLDNAEMLYNGLKDEVKAQFPTIESFLSNFGNLETMYKFFGSYMKIENVPEQTDNGGIDNATDS